MPTFAFPDAPTPLAERLRSIGNAPLPYSHIRGFGGMLHTRALSTQGRSTSELLRTL